MRLLNLGVLQHRAKPFVPEEWWTEACRSKEAFKDLCSVDNRGGSGVTDRLQRTTGQLQGSLLTAPAQEKMPGAEVSP